ncbi:MAG: hypothetical protein A2161_18655, partial [Candidatus Schekmanbacteria bacterium RBG_13_48_7]
MKQDEALQRIEEIQRIAERTTLYTLLPGLAAIIGGSLVIVGCAMSYIMIESFDFGCLIQLPIKDQIIFLVLWMVIGIAAIAVEVILTARDAKKQGIAPFGRPGKLSAYSLTPSVFVAVIITLKLIFDADMETASQNFRYLAPIWMMCYGTGVYAAGLFSVRLPRLLGLAFIMLGSVSLVFFDRYALVLVYLSFGIFHIIF